MKIKTIDKLCCPLDKADLKLDIIEQTLEEDVRLGSLTCTQCRRFYPIISGIPIMNPDEYRDLKIESIYYKYLKLEESNRKVENFRLTT